MPLGATKKIRLIYETMLNMKIYSGEDIPHDILWQAFIVKINAALKGQKGPLRGLKYSISGIRL